MLQAQGLQEGATDVPLQATGTTSSLSEDTLPPIVSQYVRHYIATKATGGLLREATALGYTTDLLPQGRPAEAVDAANQRLKSLEMVVSGQHRTTAQKVEVIPALDTSMASI